MDQNRSLALFLLIGSAFLTAPLLAHAGGTITGTVIFSGKVPAPKEFAFSKIQNPDFCKKHPNKSADGQTRLLTEVEVGKDSGLKNALVSVRDVRGKNWLKSQRLVELCKSSPRRMAHACAGVPRTKVVVELCEFLPYTSVVVNKGRFYVENHDADPNDPKSAEGVLHTPHGFDVLGDRASSLFNIALAKKGESINKKIRMRMAKAGSVMRVQCDQHEFMQSWFLPVENPYFARVNDDGTFEIKNVPAGRHKILAWHPVAGTTEAEVDVPDGGTVEANFDIKGKK